uniref:Uncharacterized protein n=1 Tax=Oryza meridionalis TaxID=40149 RepID=A0A0E0FCR6_9ORYZ
MVPGSNARCGSGGIGRRWRRRRRRRRPGAAVVEGSRSAKRTARLKGRRAAREALFGWAGNGRDRGPIPVDHPGEEIIPAHTKLCSLKSTGRDIPDNLFDGSNFLRFLKIYCFRKYDESHGIIIVSPAARLIPLINLFSL